MRAPKDILINSESLYEILLDHVKWDISNDEEGKKANLRGADLNEAILYKANLIYADLSGANLNKADLREADLNNTNLCGAFLHESNLRKANLSGANLHKAGLYKVNLSAVFLGKADLREANLGGADLSGANLFETDLCGADLSGADLYGAKFLIANLSEADLHEANLTRANLSDANLKYANLTAIIFERVVTFGWKIEGVKCDFIFLDSNKTERYPKDRDFEPGEFEALYKSVPTFEFIFEKGMAWRDAIVLDYVAANLQDEFPGLRLVRLDSRGRDPKAIFEIISKDAIDKALKLIRHEYEATIFKLRTEKVLLQDLVEKRLLQPNYTSIYQAPVNQVNQNTVIIGQLIGQVDDILKIIESEPDDSFKEKDKRTIQAQLKQIKKYIEEGAFKEVGKQMMEFGIDKLGEAIPKVAPIISQLMREFLSNGTGPVF